MASSLLGLARSEQENEKRFNSFRLYAHAGTLAVSVAALFVDDPLTYVLALIAVITEGVALAFRRYGKKLHERAERGRRHSFLDEALGPTGSPLVKARLEGEFSQRAQRTREEWEHPKYWATQGEAHAKGPALLRVNLQESAFYSADLFKVAGQRAAMRLGVSAVVLLFIALTLLSIGVGDGGQVFARIAAVVLAVLVSADEAGVMLDFFDAAKVADNTVTELTYADMGDLGNALSIYVDYQTAMTTAPPIPTPIYEKRKDDIARRWAQAVIRLEAPSDEEQP